MHGRPSTSGETGPACRQQQGLPHQGRSLLAAQANSLVQQLGHLLVVGVVLPTWPAGNEAVVIQLGHLLLGETLQARRASSSEACIGVHIIWQQAWQLRETDAIIQTINCQSFAVAGHTAAANGQGWTCPELRIRAAPQGSHRWCDLQVSFLCRQPQCSAVQCSPLWLLYRKHTLNEALTLTQ